MADVGAVAVKSTTGAITAAGVWTGVIIATIGLLVAIVKIAPRWKELGIGQRKDEMIAMSIRITELEKRVDEANIRAMTADDRSHSTEMKLVSALAAYRLIASELSRIDPNSNILKQAQELLNVSYGVPRTIVTPADTIRSTSPSETRNADPAE